MLAGKPDVAGCRRTLIRRLARTVDGDIEIPQVVLVRCRADALDSAQRPGSVEAHGMLLEVLTAR